jgi:GNAT superfamily N-acetyltransferase
MDLIITEFSPVHQEVFKNLNEQWIRHHYGEIGDDDRRILDDPNANIIDQKGKILVAEYQGKAVGVLALIPSDTDKRTIEISKMAVQEDFRNKGIARELLIAAIEKARDLNYGKIELYTHREKLKIAFQLYLKIGFRVSPDKSNNCRCDTYMVLLLEKLNTK